MKTLDEYTDMLEEAVVHEELLNEKTYKIAGLNHVFKSGRESLVTRIQRMLNKKGVDGDSKKLEIRKYIEAHQYGENEKYLWDRAVKKGGGDIEKTKGYFFTCLSNNYTNHFLKEAGK